MLGCELVCEINGQEVRVRIVETEAYDQEDEPRVYILQGIQ